MKRGHVFCAALLGLVGLAALSCSKMDRSAPEPAPANSPTVQLIESPKPMPAGGKGQADTSGSAGLSQAVELEDDKPVSRQAAAEARDGVKEAKEVSKKNGLKGDTWRGEGEESGLRDEAGRMGQRRPTGSASRYGIQHEPASLEQEKLADGRGDLSETAAAPVVAAGPAAAPVPAAPPPPPGEPAPDAPAKAKPKTEMARGLRPSAEDPFGQGDDAPAAPAELRLLARATTGKDLTAGLLDAQSGEQANEETVERLVEKAGEETPVDRFGGDAKARRRVKSEPEEPRPDHFLPRMFYFENTYLGGNAAFTRRLLALDQAWPGGEKPYARAAGPRQPFDAPGAAGLGLTVNVDRSHFEKPGRVYLQIGLQGSPRFGWRRPPLDLVLVVDAGVLGQAREAVDEIAREALRRLEPTDRLAIVIAGESPRVLLDLAGPRDLRTQMARALDALPTSVEAGTAGTLGTAIRLAGDRLRDAAGNEARIPGAQEVLVLARAADADRVGPAAEAAHEIGVAGVITSVVRFDAAGEAGAASTLAFWDIAQAGQGNLRAVDFGAPASGVITAELADLSRVVARLIRVNVRLGGRVEAIRVLGSRMLARDEVVRVKAREEAVDRNLSKTLGVKADRGADDDGVQTVIPYFYGGDAHVMALELWVDGPGPVADVSLKYKDMVNLGNATSRASVALSSTPRPRTGAEVMVQRNIDAFRAAETLAEAARRLDAGDTDGALALVAGVERSPGLGASGAVARQFGEVLRAGGDPALQSEALRLAAARTVGVFAGAR